MPRQDPNQSSWFLESTDCCESTQVAAGAFFSQLYVNAEIRTSAQPVKKLRANIFPLLCFEYILIVSRLHPCSPDREKSHSLCFSQASLFGHQFPVPCFRDFFYLETDRNLFLPTLGEQSRKTIMRSLQVRAVASLPRARDSGNWELK